MRYGAFSGNEHTKDWSGDLVWELGGSRKVSVDGNGGPVAYFRVEGLDGRLRLSCRLGHVGRYFEG